jgi:hypothetical protein
MKILEEVGLVQLLTQDLPKNKLLVMKIMVFNNEIRSTRIFLDVTYLSLLGTLDFHVTQLTSQNLSSSGGWQFGHEFYMTWIFMSSKLGFHKLLDFFPKSLRWFHSFTKHYKCLFDKQD